MVQYDPCKGAGVPLDLLASLAGFGFIEVYARGRRLRM